MKKNVPIYLNGIYIGQYLEDESLGIDSQAAVIALRIILPKKRPALHEYMAPGVLISKALSELHISTALHTKTGVDQSE